MELPQPRSYGTEGRKPTHDFLSLYTHPTHVQQDQRPPSQGGFLKTHDFLQPLERPGTMSAKEENPAEVSSAEKPPPPAPPPSVEHVLPGGIGTYTISHISYFNPSVVPKPEAAIFSAAQTSSNERNDENSNCSSYTAASGFTLWEETAAKTGKTGKENLGAVPVGREVVTRAVEWTSSMERPSQSSSNNHHNNSSVMPSSGKRNRSFVDMIKSAQYSTHDEDFDDEEDFLLKKEVSTVSQNKGELRVEVDRKSASDQKANTPRSKHSATEQRRRSKINDRFQMIREIIPHSDQKRDKASFLLEVIEYIQFLQEKVHKYEGPYPGRNHETPKLMQWTENQRPVESFNDQAQSIKSGSAPTLAYSAKIDEKSINVTPSSPVTPQNRVESDISTETTFKAMDHLTRSTNNALPFQLSPLQPSIITPMQGSGVPTQLPNPELSSSHLQTVPCPSAPCTTDVEKLTDQELTVEAGTINISSVYSQGLLNTLTQALQSSGVDLSKASVSVQIELGKRSNGRTAAPPTSTLEDREIASPASEEMRMMRNSRAGVSSREDGEQIPKRAKTSRS